MIGKFVPIGSQHYPKSTILSQDKNIFWTKFSKTKNAFFFVGANKERGSLAYNER